MDRIVEQDLEMIPVFGKKPEFEAVRNRRHFPWLGDRFEAAHDQAANFLFVVDVAVGVSHDRQIGVNAGNRLGDDVEVLGRKKRDVDACARPEFSCPLTGAIRQALADDLALAIGILPAHAFYGTALGKNAGDSRLLKNFNATHACAPRQ